MTTAAIVREYSRNILMHAEERHQRTGQYLFNGLPPQLRELTAGALWDPFHKDMSQFQIEVWLTEHVIFDDNGTIIALFDKDNILWEK